MCRLANVANKELKENFPHIVSEIYIKLHSEHVKMTLECQIFVWKVLSYAHHYFPLSVTNHTKPYSTKWDGCSHCLRSCSYLWHQSLLWKIEISDCLQTRSAGCWELMSQFWTGKQAIAVSITLCGVWYSDRKWRIVTGITQSFLHLAHAFGTMLICT